MKNQSVKTLDKIKLHLKHFYLERQFTLELTARLVGLIFFIAFLSLLPQLDCLYGATGLLPVTKYFNVLKASHVDVFNCPSLLWLKADMVGLQIISAAGLLASLTAIFNRGKTLALLICYVCYLSLVEAGQDFLSFQWDTLLLEVGFTTAFIDSRSLKPAVKGIFAWLLILIGLKLMLLSGLCKILSQDASWTNLTALSYHFYTQPLPTPLAAFLQALPSLYHKWMCGLTLTVELFCPLLIIFGRKGRLLAFFVFVVLQLLIMLSGNYGFFNWLAIVLFIPLLDDKAIAFYAHKRRQRPKPAEKFVYADTQENHQDKVKRQHTLSFYLLRQWTGMLIAVSLLSANLLFLIGYIFPLPLIMRLLVAIPQHFYLANSYGLFSVMTTSRPEIVIEGSMDGVHYRPYEFYFKAGNERRPPPIVAPYQPRLDWQLWFEALKATDHEPGYVDKIIPSKWFINLLTALQNNDPAVVSALSFNPFKSQSPRFIRARIVQYKFALPSEILHDGIYWHSDFGGSRNIYFDSKEPLF